MQERILTLRLSIATLRFYLGVLLVTNLAVLLGTWAAHTLPEQRYSIRMVLHLLNLAKENTVATWYSSMLLLSVALMSVVCFLADWQRFSQWRERVLSYGWLGFSLIFTVLSFDEIGSFHETIGDTEVMNTFGSNTGWNAFYGVIALVGLFMLAFSILRLARSGWAAAFAVVGLLLFLSNPLQENYEVSAYRAAPDPSLWVRPIWLLLLEEGSEIIASTCFLFATTRYAVYSLKEQNQPKQQPHTSHSSLTLSFSGNSFFSYLLAAIAALAAGFAAVAFGLDETMERDQGIPANWFPSGVAFVAALVSFYLHYTVTPGYHLSLQLMLALFSFALSLVYGSNLYAYSVWETSIGHLPAIIITYTAVAAAAGLCYGLVSATKDSWSRALVITWFILLAAALVFYKAYTQELAFVAFACLLLALVRDLYHTPLRARNEGATKPTYAEEQASPAT
ncbi:hypothetical protein MKJ04_10825 [Pontibacter sp. E15-1]|uniref:hypothetical protein n=1 Tax=Pontibacter sp. E15-1 TaxID=2919918 RepID=UPI001F4F9B6E|nr:hypothetical protein [Pontibacter sp. E15-1]MCJ8165338.1 hypothetical protein [Pontibacter sp. E15-1]